MQQSKMLPNDTELEKIILGAMIVDSKGYYVANNIQPLEAEDFHFSFHAKVYEVIDQLIKQDKKVDMVTVAGEFKKEKSFGEYHETVQKLVDMTSRVASSANMQTWVLTLKEYSMRRKTIQYTHEAEKKAYSNEFDIFDTLQTVQSELSNITDKLSHQGASVEHLLDEINVGAMGLNEQQAIPTGIPSLDVQINGGIEPEDYITIGGHSGQGKTALACNMCVSMIAQNVPFQFFSYEMTPKQLLLRILSSKTGIPFSKLKNGGLEEHEVTIYQAAVQEIKQKQHLIKIVDCAGMSIDVLRAKAVTEKVKTPNLGCIFIDYLQMIAPSVTEKKNGRLEQVANICYTIMGMKKSLSVPVVVLSQLRKQDNSMGAKRPTEFDIYGAQAAIACSTKIIMPHRPETFGVEEFEDGESTRNQAELLVRKNREGGTGATRVWYDAPILTFTDEKIESNINFPF